MMRVGYKVVRRNLHPKAGGNRKGAYYQSIFAGTNSLQYRRKHWTMAPCEDLPLFVFTDRYYAYAFMKKYGGNYMSSYIETHGSVTMFRCAYEEADKKLTPDSVLARVADISRVPDGTVLATKVKLL